MTDENGIARPSGECPFCGSTKTSIVEKWSANDGYWRKRTAYVRCHTCHARGPLMKTEEDFDCRNETATKEIRDNLHRMAWLAWRGGIEWLSARNPRQMELGVHHG